MSPSIIVSITYFKISGINNGIANFKIPMSTVATICQKYGLTNLKYCLIVSISIRPLSYMFYSKYVCHLLCLATHQSNKAFISSFYSSTSELILFENGLFALLHTSSFVPLLVLHYF